MNKSKAIKGREARRKSVLRVRKRERINSRTFGFNPPPVPTPRTSRLYSACSPEGLDMLRCCTSG